MINFRQCPDHQTQGLWSTFIIMIFPPHFLVTLLLQAALCIAGATNFSIDDQDSLFHYTPFSNWERITQNFNKAGGNLDKDGGHMLTYAAGSSATITYTCAYLLKVNSIIKKFPNPPPTHSLPTFISLSIFT